MPQPTDPQGGVISPLLANPNRHQRRCGQGGLSSGQSPLPEIERRFGDTLRDTERPDTLPAAGEAPQRLTPELLFGFAGPSGQTIGSVVLLHADIVTIPPSRLKMRIAGRVLLICSCPHNMPHVRPRRQMRFTYRSRWVKSRREQAGPLSALIDNARVHR
jgi:hypothetical protein